MNLAKAVASNEVLDANSRRMTEMQQAVKSWKNISFLLLSSSLGSCFTPEVLEALSPFMKPLSKSLMPLAPHCRQNV